MTKFMKTKITKELIDKLRTSITKIEVKEDDITITIDHEKWDIESMYVFEGYALDYEIDEFYECVDRAFNRLETEIKFLLGGI